MKREIVMFGSQILRKSCPPVKEVDDDIRALVSDLFDSMRAAEGIGMSWDTLQRANQEAVADPWEGQVERMHAFVQLISRGSTNCVLTTCSHPDISGGAFRLRERAGMRVWSNTLQSNMDDSFVFRLKRRAGSMPSTKNSSLESTQSGHLTKGSPSSLYASFSSGSSQQA